MTKEEFLKKAEQIWDMCEQSPGFVYCGDGIAPRRIRQIPKITMEYITVGTNMKHINSST